MLKGREERTQNYEAFLWDALALIIFFYISNVGMINPDKYAHTQANVIIVLLNRVLRIQKWVGVRGLVGDCVSVYICQCVIVGNLLVFVF